MQLSFVCCFWIWDLAWSRCSMQLFPPVSVRGRRLTMSYSLLVPILLYSLWRLEHVCMEAVWGSSVRTVSVLVWEAVGRITPLPESGRGVGELSGLCSDFLAPWFPEPRVLPAPLQNCFHFMSKKKKKSLETWK